MANSQRLAQCCTMLAHCCATFFCTFFWYFLESSTVRSSAIVCIYISSCYLNWKILVYWVSTTDLFGPAIDYVEIVSSQTEFGTHPPPHTTTIRQFFFKTLFLENFQSIFSSFCTIAARLGPFFTPFGAKLPFLVLFGDFFGEHSCGFASKGRGRYLPFPQQSLQLQ